MNKVSLTDIITNDVKLKEYISSLEDDIAKSESVDIAVNNLLDNLLIMFDGFKDRRSLRASNIDSITSLLKLKADLPMQRVKIKKTALDILTKKRELEIKDKAASAVNNIALNSGELLRSIYLKLDQQNIHPEIESVDVINAECTEIIEQPKLEAECDKSLNKKTEKVENVKNTVNLQLELDNIENSKEDANV